MLTPSLPPLDRNPTAYRAERHAAVYSRARRVVRKYFKALAAPVPVGGLGGDVSKWQASIDWQKAKANGWKFVFIRVLYGMAVDSKFTAHWINSKVAGVLRGAYAYYLDAEDPEAQAQKLFDTLSATGNLGDLPVIADIEEYGNVQITSAKVKKYLEKLTELFGAGNVIIYTGKSVWDTWIGDVAWAKAYPLWLAQYTLVGWQENHLEKVRNYPPTPPKPWVMWDGNENTPLAGYVAIWQFTASCPAELYGVSGTVVDLDYVSPAFAKKYLGGPPPIVPPPTAEGDPLMQFKALDTFNIRSSPASLTTNDVGDLPKDAVIAALEVRPTDNNSVWVRFTPLPAWITKTVPEYWAAMVHDGQGPLLGFHAAVPCPEGDPIPMTPEQLARLTAVEALTATHETEITALQNILPGGEVFVPTHRVVTTKPGGEKLRAWPGGSEAVQVYNGLDAMMLNQFRGGQELMAVKKSGIVITGWLAPGNITPL